MKRAIRWGAIVLGLKKPQSYFPGEKQLYLFTKRPILHHDFTAKFLHDAIHELQAILQAKNLLSNQAW